MIWLALICSRVERIIWSVSFFFVSTGWFATATVSFLPIAVWIFLVDRHEANKIMNAAKKTNLVMNLFFTSGTKSACVSMGFCQHSYFFPSNLLYFLYYHLCNSVARV